MANMETASPKQNGNSTLYYITAILTPSILLFDLYNRNHVENIIAYAHVLVLAGILAVAGLCLSIIFRLAANSLFGGLLTTFAFWLCFWLFQPWFNAVMQHSAPLTFLDFIVLLGIILAIMIVVFRRYALQFTKVKPAFNALALSLVVLFIFNLIPGINHEIILRRGVTENAESFYIKRNFHIDTTLPSPDIYWFFADGMMSFETVERFWGESLESLRDEFTNRGFLVYENAQLNAGFTYAALPALLSPAFYDSFWGRHLAETETELRNSRAQRLDFALVQAGLTYSDIMLYAELFSALITRGYEMNIRNRVGLPRNFDHLTGNYDPDRRQLFLEHWHNFLAGDLSELLSLTTPLNFTYDPDDVNEPEPVVTEVRQNDYRPDPVARFTWRRFTRAHMSFAWRHDSDLTQRDRTAIHVYPTAFEYVSQQMFLYIDNILERNPNAVIVIQSDHGFHMVETQQHLIEQGYSLEQVLELTHSVFSAVRISPAYGGLDAPIAPLNISRELVNRFVGENYTLLP